MLLSYHHLVRLVAAGVIKNVEHDQINAASIDVTLGTRVLFEHTPNAAHSPTLRLSERDAMGTYPVDITTEYELAPGEFVLACTQQVFHLPNNISAEFKLKSSVARIGLEHLNAGWCDAGGNGSVLTLELKNVTRFHNIAIRAGDPIGQVIFHRHDPVPVDRSYAARGRYNHDTTTEGAKK